MRSPVGLRCWRGRASVCQSYFFIHQEGKTYDSARGTEGLCGEVRGEFGLDNTGVSVRSRDSAPDDSDSTAVDLTLGLVDVGDSLVVSWFMGY